MISQNQFCLLAQFTPRGTRLNYQGLKIIEYYDYVAVVTLQGVFESRNTKSSLINSKTRIQIKSSNEGVWISKYPKYNHKINKYIILLRIVGQNQQSLAASHCFCAMISNFMVLIWNDSLNKNFLGSIRQKMKNIAEEQSTKIAALCTFPKKDPNDSATFAQSLERQNIQMKYVELYHPKIYKYDQITKLEIDQISASGGNIISTLFRICPNMQKQVLEGKYGNQQLIHGPAIKSFIENLIEIYKETGQFDVETAQDQIEVQQQFQEYMLGVEKFNAKCKSRLGSQPIQDIKAMTYDIREQIENQKFYRNSPYYAQKITVYMDRKEEELIKLNQQLLDSQNLNLLQALSQQTLRKVKKNKKITPQQVNLQLDQLINKYNIKSINTTNKDKLLTQFLQVYRPTLYDQSNVDNNLNRQVQDVEESNLKLRKQIAELQSKYKKNGKGDKKGGKNNKGQKCCAIM